MARDYRQNRLKLEQTLHPIDYVALICVYVAAVIVPLIILVQKIKLEGDFYTYWTGKDIHYDFFSSSKAQVLQICLAVLVIYGVYSFYKKRPLLRDRIFIPLGFYALTLVLSTLFSKHLDVALQGFTDRWEGFYILSTYVLLTVITAYLMKDYKNANHLLIGILISSLVITFLGITQFYGVDFLQTQTGKKMILGDQYAALAEGLDFKFSRQRVMYTTVYNPNYLGSYSVLTLPIAICLFYAYIKEKLWKKALMLIFVGAEFILWLGGLSRAGILGGLVMFIVLVVFLRKRIITYWKSSVVILVTMVLLYGVMDMTSGGIITKEFYNTLPSSLQSMLKKPVSDSAEPQASQQQETTKKRLEKLELKNNVLTIGTETETLTLKYEGDTIALSDEKGQTLIPVRDENTIKLEDERYTNYTIIIDTDGIRLQYYGIDIPIYMAEGVMKLVVSKSLMYDTVGPVQKIGFEKAEAFGSGRGFIWSRSIPLIKDTLILGHGPDTYPIFFPQDDIAGKINGLNGATLVVDKPHNWYLQLAINTGLLSLIAMLTFLAWYLIRSTKRYIKDDLSPNHLVAAGAISAVTGYCISVIFNDSNVAVAPVFWIILGIGIAFIKKGVSEKIK